MSIKVTDLTSDELITHIQHLTDVLDEIRSIVGDTPVSEQISVALDYVAPKKYVHEECVSRAEHDALKQRVDAIASLIGDTSVAEQISTAINQIENT